MKRLLFVGSLFLLACQPEETSPIEPSSTLEISFANTSINLSTVDYATIEINTDSGLFQKTFTKLTSSLSVELGDINGDYDITLMIFTKQTLADYARQYILTKEVRFGPNTVVENAPTGSITGDWLVRSIIRSAKANLTMGLAPDDPYVRLEVIESEKWDHFYMDKTILYSNQGTVLIGAAQFQTDDAIDAPGFVNEQDLDLTNEVKGQMWNILEFSALLMDADTGEELVFYNRIVID